MNKIVARINLSRAFNSRFTQPRNVVDHGKVNPRSASAALRWAWWLELHDVSAKVKVVRNRCFRLLLSFFLSIDLRLLLQFAHVLLLIL